MQHQAKFFLRLSGFQRRVEGDDFDEFVRPTGMIVRKGKLLTQAGRYLIELLGKRSDSEA